jgi:hypothetical protein
MVFIYGLFNTFTAGHLYGCLYLNAGVLKQCSNYRVFLYKKSLCGKYWRKKIEIFNIPRVSGRDIVCSSLVGEEEHRSTRIQIEFHT